MIRADVWQIFQLKVTSFFSPVINTYFFLGQTLFPFNPTAYHMVGLGFHIANTYLVYILLRQVFPERIDAAYIGATFFALASYHFEAVLWISSIMHVLVTFFILLGLVIYTYYVVRPRWYYLLLSLSAGIFAFFTKENGIVFPILIAGFYAFARFTKKTTVGYRHLWLYGALLAALLGLSFYWQHDSMWVSNGVYTITIRAAYPLVASFLALFHEPLVVAIVQRPILIAGLLIGVIAGVWIGYAAYRKHLMAFLLGVGIVIVSFLPVIFFYFGSWLTVAQHRYGYLPSIGAAMMFSWVYLALLSSIKWRIMKVAAVLLFLFYLTAQVSMNQQTFARDYAPIEEQMIGMMQSFQELEPSLTPHRHIVMVGEYPFRGNEYYRFMYRYFIDPAQQKSIDDWSLAHTHADALVSYVDPKYLWLEWDNVQKKVVPVVREIDEHGIKVDAR